jgi:hypothetical protein
MAFPFLGISGRLEERTEEALTTANRVVLAFDVEQLPQLA